MNTDIITVGNVIQDLYKFQIENNISRSCVKNSVLLYNLCKYGFQTEIKVIAGYIVKFKVENGQLFQGVNEHVWCEYEGKILEPSYDYYLQQPHIKYVKNFCDIDSNIIPKHKKRQHILKRLQLEQSAQKQMTNEEEYPYIRQSIQAIYNM